MSQEEIAPTPANENPWYLLATVYGEQEEDASHWHFDRRALAAKNRIAWNRWMASALSVADKTELAKKGLFSAELVAFDETERARFLKDFAARAGVQNFVPPDLNHRITFERTSFARAVDFDGFVFADNAFFDRATFLRDASFDGAVFCRLASFEGSIFSDYVSFDAAAFSDDTIFESVEFCSGASFSGAVFSCGAYFEHSAFSCAASFVGAEFKINMSFEGVKFFCFAPDFRNANFPEVTEWHDVTWPPPPRSAYEAHQQIYAYEILKAEMERLKKHADEQFFFAKELRARRVLEPVFSLKWLLYSAYEQFGGYGQSVAQPLLGLILFWAVGSGLFSFLPAASGRPLHYEDAALLSLVNLIPFLPYKAAEEVMKHLDYWVKWFGIFQAIIGAVLLFLFGLALRNLFRMK